MGQAREPRPLVALGVGAVVAVGMACRVLLRSELWLDEALSVNIASLAPGDLFEALRHDGHPPLYYLLLHGWMELFGDSNVAVRSLSAVFGTAALPVAWLIGRRYGGPLCATAALVLLASSPFGIRYSSEARMYSLVMLLVLAGWLAVRVALDRPTTLRLLPVALVAGALALTHYWAFYLLAATGALLVVLWRRGRPAALRVGLALVAGGVLFLPWLPSFLEQAANTGTPWGRPERPTTVMAVSFTDWGGGPNGEAQTLGIGLVLLILVALLGRATGPVTLEVDVRTRPHAVPEAVVAFLTMAIAVAAGYVTSSAFASRYTSVVFPLAILLAAYGVAQLPRRAVGIGLVLLAVLGLVGGIRNTREQRTQAGILADYIVSQGLPGDVVAFCPDQLGPAVDRLLPEDRVKLTYPEGTKPPELVDWVDYEERMAAGDPAEFAEMLLERRGAGTLWYVWSPGYRTLDQQCEEVVEELDARASGQAVVESGGQFEHAWLSQYGPGRNR